jgi:RNA polymerase sigma-54 factor
MAATRLLALPSDAVAMLAAQAALENPALRLGFDLDDAPPSRPPGQFRIALPPVARLDETTLEAGPRSLYDHVAVQIPLLVRDPGLLPIAQAWLEGLEPTGWVGLAPQDVAARCRISEDRAEYVLHLLQGAEPDGLFARSLQECLTIQLRAQGDLTPGMAAILADLPLLASGDLSALADRTGILPAALPGMVGRLRRLNPKPGAQFLGGQVALAAPDLLIERQKGGGWDMRRGRWLRPTLSPAAPGARFLAADLRRASAFAGLAEHRDRLIFTAVRHALEWQSDFVEGVKPWPRPMALADLAVPLGVHETSIGRIRNHVVIGDGARAIRLRDLFASTVVTSSGAAISPQELAARIAAVVVSAAQGRRPTDDAIRQELSRAGIAVSRRTVTKYRSRPA